jgi:hypothetical protein
VTLETARPSEWQMLLRLRARRRPAGKPRRCAAREAGPTRSHRDGRAAEGRRRRRRRSYSYSMILQRLGGHPNFVFNGNFPSLFRQSVSSLIDGLPSM